MGPQADADSPILLVHPQYRLLRVGRRNWDVRGIRESDDSVNEPTDVDWIE